MTARPYRPSSSPPSPAEARYQDLRGALLKLFYARLRLGQVATDGRVELARTHARARRLARAGQDERARALIAEHAACLESVQAVERELKAVGRAIEVGKAELESLSSRLRRSQLNGLLDVVQQSVRCIGPESEPAPPREDSTARIEAELDRELSGELLKEQIAMARLLDRR